MEISADRHGSGRGINLRGRNFHRDSRQNGRDRSFNRRRGCFRRQLNRWLFDCAVVQFENKNSFKKKHADAPQNGQRREQIKSLVVSFFFHAGQSVRFSLFFQLQTLFGNIAAFKTDRNCL